MAQTPRKLTIKRELFIREYLIDFNATQAAIRAGYSKKSAGATGHEILKNPEVLARVKAAQAERVQRLCINADWVVLKLVQVVDKAMQAVPVEKWDAHIKEMVETGEYVFDSKGANNALQMLGKHVGMFDRQEAESSAAPMDGFVRAFEDARAQHAADSQKELADEPADV